jgi:hypothetical protein
MTEVKEYKHEHFEEDKEELKRTGLLSDTENAFKWCMLLVQRKDSIEFLLDKYPHPKVSRLSLYDLFLKCERVSSPRVQEVGMEILNKLWWNLPDTHELHKEPVRKHFMALCGFVDGTWEFWSIKPPAEGEVE